MTKSAATIAAIVEQRKQSDAEYRRTRYGELVETERKATGLSEDLIKARRRAALQVLTAPVDGTVQQLAVHTVGGVVTPAQTLLVVVPVDSHLEIEAMVSESGHRLRACRPGSGDQGRHFQFHPIWPHRRQGRERFVGRDHARQAADRANPNQQGAQDELSEPTSQELVYAARVSLDRTQMQVEDKLLNLSPGMAVTVEIKTGSRRIISYLLSPLLKYKQEVLRER